MDGIIIITPMLELLIVGLITLCATNIVLDWILMGLRYRYKRLKQKNEHLEALIYGLDRKAQSNDQ